MSKSKLVLGIIVIVAVIGGFFVWHSKDKQKNTLDGTWVEIETSKIGGWVSADEKDFTFLTIKGDKYTVVNKSKSTAVIPVDAKGTIKFDAKENTVNVANEKTKKANKFNLTGSYTLSDDKDLLTLNFYSASDKRFFNTISEFNDSSHGYLYVRKDSKLYKKLVKDKKKEIQAEIDNKKKYEKDLAYSKAFVKGGLNGTWVLKEGSPEPSYATKFTISNEGKNVRIDAVKANVSDTYADFNGKEGSVSVEYPDGYYPDKDYSDFTPNISFAVQDDTWYTAKTTYYLKIKNNTLEEYSPDGKYAVFVKEK